MRRIFSIVVGNLLAALVLGACHRNPVMPSSTGVTQSSLLAVHAIRIGSPETKTLTPGGSVQLSATAQRGNGMEEDVTSLATWSSDNDRVATVSSSGLVSAAGPGTANIRAAYQSITGETSIDVSATPPTVAAPSPSPSPSPDPSPSPGPSPAPNPSPSPSPAPSPLPVPLPPTVQTLTITGGTTVPVGQSLQLRATGHMSDGTDRDVTSTAQWSTTNPSGASVSQSGVVTGSSAGPNVVTARYNGASAAQPVQVTPF